MLKGVGEREDGKKDKSLSSFWLGIFFQVGERYRRILPR